MAPSLRPLPVHPREASSRPVRSSRKRVKTYRETSSDEEDSAFLDDTDSYDSVESNVLASPVRRPLTRPEDTQEESLPHQIAQKLLEASSAPSLPKRVTRTSSTRAKRALFAKNTPRSAASRSPKKQKLHVQSHPVYQGVIPPWQELPYHVLADIFKYTFSLSGARTLAEVTRSVRWLLNTSRLCRAFFEPAIATLYYSPPLFPPSRLAGLLNLLQQPQEALFTNYRAKIKRLDILFRHYHSRHLDISQLVALTPQLKHLRLHDSTELDLPPPLNTSYRSQNWDNFLDALDENGIRLHSWEWNGDFFSPARLFQPRTITAVHNRPAFNTLRSLRLFNLAPTPVNTTNSNAPSNEPKPGETLASTLSLLPDLRELEFHGCLNVDDDLLSSLSLNLRSLTLVSCNHVSSPNLGIYLARHGRSLRVLVLEHNRYLNMSFTVNLAEWCPRLQVFMMDLNFSSPRYYTHDVDPYFDELFYDSEVPSWPSTLQTLKLERLRKWEISTAVLFFDSLINSAPQLKDLRTLVMSAILEIGWRDRAKFRKEWVGKLERTYLRKSPPPNPSRKSVPKMIALHGNTSPDGPRPLDSKAEANPESPSRGGHRQSKRIAEQKSVENSDDEPFELARPENAANGDTSSSANDNVPIQGMCDVVEIRVDNLRPADYLLTNDNFEDEEISGDEDWSGQDPDDGDGYAW
ncbi:hypothetical protein FQN55_001076 [Onygenales sp. PD_40]|nr:hypothetical protein FQN55_001076 [Onygenales sp. PD_40]